MELFDGGKYRGKRIAVALSGGVDSVCLLHAFYAQASDMGITLSAIHVEHGIRGEESLRDMRFCEELCERWGIPLKIVREDVPKLVKEQGGSVEAVTALFTAWLKRAARISSQRRTMRMTWPRPFSSALRAERDFGA